MIVALVRGASSRGASAVVTPTPPIRMSVTPSSVTLDSDYGRDLPAPSTVATLGSPGTPNDHHGHEVRETTKKKKKKAAGASDGVDEADKWNFSQACALNALNMFGTGPFITCALLFRMTTPAGPHALIAYGVAGVVCCFDALVWGELASIWPYTGGSYVYLSELFGRESYRGKLLSFLYLWQFMISGPLEVASGFVAASEYLRFFVSMSDWAAKGVAFALSVACFVAMYTGMRESARVTEFLWLITILAVGFVLVAGFANFDAQNLESPPGWAASLGWREFGALMRVGLYDFAGYYDTCHIGDHIRDPAVVIPKATYVTCAFVVGMCMLVYVALLGVLSAGGIADAPNNFVASAFTDALFGRAAAVAFTVVVVVTIVASCYSLIVGYVMLPFVAARDGYFFEWFHHTHKTKRGLPDRSLLACGVVTSLCCFLNLDVLIESLMTTRAIVQFCAQAVGTIVHRRKRPDKRGPFRMPLFPIPALVSLFGFGYVLITTTSAMAGDATPLLEISLAYLFLGWAMHFVWSRSGSRNGGRGGKGGKTGGKARGKRGEGARRGSMELAGSAATAADAGAAAMKATPLFLTEEMLKDGAGSTESRSSPYASSRDLLEVGEWDASSSSEDEVDWFATSARPGRGLTRIRSRERVPEPAFDRL